MNALNWSRYRASKKGYSHDLTHKQLETKLGETCYYCDVEFNYQGSRRSKERSPTIDRINRDEGYQDNNIVVCCHRCNAIKSDATCEELEQLACRLRQALTEQQSI